MLFYVALSVSAVISFAFCYVRRSGFSVKNALFKAAASLCFILTGVIALIYNPVNTEYGALLIMGAALGLFGDILLDFKGVYEKDKITYMFGGFIAFLLGHIFYTTAIIRNAALKWQTVLICAAVAIVVSVINTAMGKVMKLDFGKFKGIVLLYTAFLTMTLLCSVAAAVVTKGNSGYIIMSVGALMFLLSDAVLSNTFFGKGFDKPVHYFINHFLYYAGQLLIAASIMFVK